MYRSRTQRKWGWGEIGSYYTASGTQGAQSIFSLVGRVQTINGSNYFGVFVFTACNMSSIKVGNKVLLNHSTIGVSCETTWNFTTKMKYLRGNINHIQLLDMNHNVKILLPTCWRLLWSCNWLILPWYMVVKDARGWKRANLGGVICLW